eukprot:scaffold415680_cov43-Prasinocladus_malaysianus.AAC.1
MAAGMPQTNIKTLTTELLDYLTISDTAFKPDLTQKIALLVQKYAPDRRWYAPTTFLARAILWLCDGFDKSFNTKSTDNQR